MESITAILAVSVVLQCLFIRGVQSKVDIGYPGRCELLTFSVFELGDVSDQIQFSYQVTNKSLVVPGNFTFILTSVFYKDVESDCPKGYFDCNSNNNRCVKDAVVCNGYPDCAQPLFSEDENDCSSGNDLSLLQIIGITVGSVAALLVIIGGILVVLKRNNMLSYESYE